MLIGARTAVVALAAIAIAATSCTRVIDDARVVAAPDMGKAGATAEDCTKVDTPLTTIPSQGNDEPVLKIPQPDNWQRVSMLDSPLIRFTMRNASLARDAFAPTVVVTLESHRGIAEPAVVFDAQQDALRTGIGATNLRVTETTLCSLPAEIIDYITPPLGILPPHPARVLCAVLHTENRTYAMTMTVQSADPGNRTYQRDAETILRGFQMLPPTT
jgi:hypothetical protein